MDGQLDFRTGVHTTEQRNGERRHWCSRVRRRLSEDRPGPFALMVVVCLGLAGPCAAVTCNVPSAPHATIQAAVDDVGCTDVVIDAGTYVESPVIARSLDVQGAGSSSTSILGQVEISAGTVGLSGIYIAAPNDALVVHSGAEVAGFDLEVVSGAVEPPLFADDFEDGTTGAWDGVSP